MEFFGQGAVALLTFLKRPLSLLACSDILEVERQSSITGWIDAYFKPTGHFDTKSFVLDGDALPHSRAYLLINTRLFRFTDHFPEQFAQQFLLTALPPILRLLVNIDQAPFYIHCVKWVTDGTQRTQNIF